MPKPSRKRIPKSLPEFGLTERQRELLSPRNLEAYVALDDGRVEPANDKQRHFVDVCRRNVPPVTEVERAYLLWRKLTGHKAVSRNVVVKASQKTSAKTLQKMKTINPTWPDWIQRELECPKEHNRGFAPKPMTSGDAYNPRYTPSTASSPQQNGLVRVNSKRYVTESWGSRAAWARDRSSWKKTNS